MTTVSHPDPATTTSETAVSSSPAGDARAIVGVALFSAQPGKLAAFYGMLLGLRFERRLHPDGREHRIAKIGPEGSSVHFEIKLSVTPAGQVTPDATPSAGHGASEISFEVQDAHAAFDYALVLGATELLPITDKPYGLFGSVLDPDGNRVGLYSPLTQKEGS